ncbi:hypothetical protein C0214_06255 [Methylobacterium sp. DM1]|uniref:Uncharacterized protein n=1 Tax=Methylorubrum extorquens (strain ATCC 14718 / DSM 1338 / JCM 2805 / NCIMB 9133 / AM1) TaxID=272630 RepID=C5B3L3_METEA|nr:Hypothetical protein MexAM1_META2p0118 [Methylorubrum extorquens AM1]AWI87930.1 hypothetical protein C0214_06255 [Methylobacterium sp. DM1]
MASTSTASTAAPLRLPPAWRPRTADREVRGHRRTIPTVVAPGPEDFIGSEVARLADKVGNCIEASRPGLFRP